MLQPGSLKDANSTGPKQAAHSKTQNYLCMRNYDILICTCSPLTFGCCSCSAGLCCSQRNESIFKRINWSIHPKRPMSVHREDGRISTKSTYYCIYYMYHYETIYNSTSLRTLTAYLYKKVMYDAFDRPVTRVILSTLFMHDRFQENKILYVRSNELSVRSSDYARHLCLSTRMSMFAWM